jgi:creatinine amidohydrolase
MSAIVTYAELPWPELQRRLAGGAVVFLPLGSTEQHGHHMAVNVDVVLPQAICEHVATSVGGLVLPPLAYGMRSQPRTGGGPQFPGTINITATTFAALVRDILLDLHRQGARRIVLVNGHYENVWPSIEGVEQMLDALGRDRRDGPTILRVDHWELVKPDTIARIFPSGYPGIELEHASVIETSMMLALRPDLVDLAKSLHDGPAAFKPYDRYPRPPAEVPPSGVLSMTAGASAEKGQWLLDDIVSRLEAAVREEFGL